MDYFEKQVAYEKQLSKSAYLFKNIVWAYISKYFKNGRLELLEGNTTKQIEDDFDQIAGIDYWYIQKNKQRICGIASRVSQLDNPYDNFTIRYKLSSGYKTEYDKRIDAINNDYVYPKLTIQANVSMDNKFISCGIISTKILYKFVQKNLNILPKIINNSDGNKFIPITWDMLTRKNIKFKLINNKKEI